MNYQLSCIPGESLDPEIAVSFVVRELNKRDASYKAVACVGNIVSADRVIENDFLNRMYTSGIEIKPKA